MKVKLLRKIRRRFYWFRKEGDRHFTLYDKKKCTEEYCYKCGYYTSEEMVLCIMLAKIGKEDLFAGKVEKNRKRKELSKKRVLRKKYDFLYKNPNNDGNNNREISSTETTSGASLPNK